MIVSVLGLSPSCVRLLRPDLESACDIAVILIAVFVAVDFDAANLARE